MKIAVYFNHIESLGHTTRTFKLAEGLKKEINGSEVMVLQGGKPQKFFAKPGGVDVFDVPDPFTSRDWCHTSSSSKQLTMKDMVKRFQFIKGKINEFKPDIFITEFFPFGREIEKYELIPVLNYLKKRTDIKAVSSVGYPLMSLPIATTKEYLKYYEKVVIHSLKELDFEAIKAIKGSIYSKAFESIKEKTAFSGYVFNKSVKEKKEKVKEELGAAGKKLVLVSRGGLNAMQSLLYKSVLAARKLGDEYVFAVIAGPATSRAEMETLKKIASKTKNARVILYSENFYDLMNACDLSISVTGYNTSCELMKLRKKSIVVPYYRPKQNPAGIEQYYRAKILEKVINSKVLLPYEITPGLLAKAVEEKIKEEKTMNVNDEWFNGIKNTAKLLGGLA